MKEREARNMGGKHLLQQKHPFMSLICRFFITTLQ